MCIIMPPPQIGGGIKRRCCLASVCLSRTSGLSRVQEDQNWHRGSPRHTWLGTTFKVKRSRSPGRLCSPQCSRVRRLQRWGWKRVGRGKLLLRCRLLGGAYIDSPINIAKTRGRREAGHIVAATRLQLVHNGFEAPPPLCRSCCKGLDRRSTEIILWWPDVCCGSIYRARLKGNP